MEMLHNRYPKGLPAKLRFTFNNHFNPAWYLSDDNKLPDEMLVSQVIFLWDNIAIPAHAVFLPDELTYSDFFQTYDVPSNDDELFRTSRNIETRRAMIECIGYERFLKILGDDAIVLDTDTDAGGERKLIMVDNRMAFDNSTLQLLQVTCPSTGHQYILRVPPHMATCHQAAAWVAGFDNPDDYHPIKES